MNQGLPNKRIKIEQFDLDWNCFSMRTGYYLVKVNCDLFDVLFIYVACYC